MQYRYPVPTQALLNGEFTPPRQTVRQIQAELTMLALADEYGGRQGMGRRQFLKSASGMAAAFLAMNSVYGPIFDVLPAEAADIGTAKALRRSLDSQFIFDVQLHFGRDGYARQGLRYARNRNEGPAYENGSPEQLKFRDFIREVFEESQTDVGLLSGAFSDDPEKCFRINDEIAETRSFINHTAEGRRMLSHAIFTPGEPGWLEEMDRSIEQLHPDSWKGYTAGDPLRPGCPWRLDDEALVYPAYEKMVKSGIHNVCIHKGLLPEDYHDSSADLRQYANVDDVGKAARDWPQLNFIIYHSARRSLSDFSRQFVEKFEKNGYIPWVTDLAAIPFTFGVKNVYAALGDAFAASAVIWPRYCGGLLGTLIKGMGVDKVLWGTGSVRYGSPQWQIEAFRRIETPMDLQERFRLPPLGSANSYVKNAIFGLNAARLYNLDPTAAARLADFPLKAETTAGLQALALAWD